MQDKFEIGQIVNTFGIKGEVKVNPYTDDINQFKKIKVIYIKNKAVEVESAKFHKNFVILKIKGIDTINDAEMLRNEMISVNRSNKKLPQNTYYIADLIGLKVYSEENNEYIGKVKDIYNTGANDIYVVENEESKEILLPAIKEVVKKVDLENNKIIVQILKGLV